MSVTAGGSGDDGQAPRLRISVLGGAYFSYGGRDVELRNRKAKAIFAYLALTPAAEEPREKLAGLFWSEFSEGNARATLRQAIHEFREALDTVGCPAAAVSRTSVGLRGGSFSVDLDELLAAVAAKEAPEALLRQERLAETLLAGFDDLDQAFHTWLMARRQALHDRLIRGLEDGYRDEALERRRRWRLAEATLLLDPTHEEACRVVMRCAAEAGETSAAIRVYDALYRLLDEDYDMEPSLATQELVAEVKQGKFDTIPQEEPDLSVSAEMKGAMVAPRRARATNDLPPMASKPALFVESFGMSGVDPDSIHLVQGFRIELIASLTRFREWYVAGGDPKEDGNTSGVRVSARYGITTTAYQAGASINVVMVLQEMPSGLAIWGERFELRLDRWSEAQQRIVRRIAATLQVQVSSERLSRFSQIPDGSLESYDVWLRGQWMTRDFNPEVWNRVASMFAQGIERAPAFSPLYSGLAQLNNAVHFMQPGLFRDPEKTARTLALAKKAVALDADDSRAELCLGWAWAMSRRHVLAENHMDRACSLNSNDSWTMISAAMFHAFCGNAERARVLADHAMDMTLTPIPRHWVYEVSIRFLGGDNAGTLEAVAGARDTLLTVPAWHAAALANLGRLREARAEMERFHAVVRVNWTNEQAPTDEMIAGWLLQAYPISQRAVWERFRDGLAAAGMNVDGQMFADEAEPGAEVG